MELVLGHIFSQEEICFYKLHSITLIRNYIMIALSSFKQTIFCNIPQYSSPPLIRPPYLSKICTQNFLQFAQVKNQYQPIHREG